MHLSVCRVKTTFQEQLTRFLVLCLKVLCLCLLYSILVYTFCTLSNSRNVCDIVIHFYMTMHNIKMKWPAKLNDWTFFLLAVRLFTLDDFPKQVVCPLTLNKLINH